MLLQPITDNPSLGLPPRIFVVRGRPGQDDRPALPSGHPVTWGAITDGTILEHAAYPFPVFLP